MLDINKLIQESHCVVSDQYTDAYPHLISYFEGKTILTLEDFVRGAHMVYAWMPTILTLHSDGSNNHLDKTISLINLVKKQGEVDESQITAIKKVVNNSIVGASKLLHFISPTDFPIWDSRVYFYLHNKTPHGNRVNNARQYLDYINILRQTVALDDFKEVRDTVSLKIGYEVTSMRAVELIMFQNSSHSKALV